MGHWWWGVLWATGGVAVVAAAAAAAGVVVVVVVVAWLSSKNHLKKMHCRFFAEILCGLMQMNFRVNEDRRITENKATAPRFLVSVEGQPHLHPLSPCLLAG